MSKLCHFHLENYYILCHFYIGFLRFKVSRDHFYSGGASRATPGRARSNALAKKLLHWLAPWLAPWLTEISINAINCAQQLIYMLQNISRDSYSIPHKAVIPGVTGGNFDTLGNFGVILSLPRVLGLGLGLGLDVKKERDKAPIDAKTPKTQNAPP